jgi:hypothetical protein
MKYSLWHQHKKTNFPTQSTVAGVVVLDFINKNWFLLIITNRQVQLTIRRLSQNHFHHRVAVQTKVSGQFQETDISQYRYTEATSCY